jgi:hypothetical protein
MAESDVQVVPRQQPATGPMSPQRHRGGVAKKCRYTQVAFRKRFASWGTRIRPRQADPESARAIRTTYRHLVRRRRFPLRASVRNTDWRCGPVSRPSHKARPPVSRAALLLPVVMARWEGRELTRLGIGCGRSPGRATETRCGGVGDPRRARREHPPRAPESNCPSVALPLSLRKRAPGLILRVLCGSRRTLRLQKSRRLMEDKPRRTLKARRGRREETSAHPNPQPDLKGLQSSQHS